MADRLDIRPGVAIPLAEVELRTSRSSGPGGQHANVTASRVEAVFDVHASAALSDAQKARIAAPARTACHRHGAGHPLAQLRNRELALERLAARLGAAPGGPSRPGGPTRPTAGAKRRRIDAKKRRGEVKRGRRRPGARGVTRGCLPGSAS